ncbi:metal-dependent hydrolase [Ureibacillus acetophenoni]|uniref:Membrane-bound metal-dependent hydrolase YbcI n=1 Tax=Ureibacillus acetophenoni TaxID=614649 RepID=A0A285UT66_9BACL|nr:metal-dependent hydrolase [Ureibacillus acetophenoni]SOC45054.1 membrane-bound metal-dependent hydrolase YbcI [Ureibacillus acetophenoni]
MLLLFMHVLTHALFGAIIVFLLKDARNLSIPKKLVLSIIGGFAGILPDTLGFRTSTPWSHSIFFAPIFVLPVVLVTKAIFREIIWWKIWIVLSLATIVGHIFVDFLTHEVTLLYPLSLKEYEYVIFEAGDPWVWFPLMITILIVIFSSKNRILSISIVFLLIGSYMGVRSYSKLELISKLEDYYGEINQNILVTPPRGNLIDTRNPFDYLKWSYDLYSEQRIVRGFSPLLGGTLQNHTNVFHQEPMPVVLSVTGPYRKAGGEVDQSFNVLLDVRDDGNYYLVCEEMNSNHLKVFRQEIDGRWNEIQGTEMQRILDYFIENEKKSNMQ